MKKSKNYLIPICSSIIMLGVSAVLLTVTDITELFGNNNVLFYLIMYLYATLKAINYVCVRKTDEYESLLICMASVIAGTAGIIFSNENAAKVLALTIGGWLIIVSVIKLIKINYAKSKNNFLWYVRLIFFFTFILAGLLASVNLYFSISEQTVMIGFLFLINGVIDITIAILEMLKIKEELNPKVVEEVPLMVEIEEKGVEVLGKVEDVKPKVSSPRKPKSTSKKTPKKAVKKEIKTTSKKVTVKKQKPTPKAKSKATLKKPTTKKAVKKESPKKETKAKVNKK